MAHKTPNLSLKGEVNRPTLVVAPIRVKSGKSNLIDLAAAPFPITMSKHNPPWLDIKFLPRSY